MQQACITDAANGVLCTAVEISPFTDIERMFARLKINRAIATRYDQLANSFLGMAHLATARYWLKFVHAV